MVHTKTDYRISVGDRCENGAVVLDVRYVGPNDYLIFCLWDKGARNYEYVSWRAWVDADCGKIRCQYGNYYGYAAEGGLATALTEFSKRSRVVWPLR